MANNGADVKPNQGVGATNTSTTTNTAENTVGTATPKQNGLAVLGKYMGVSATQTIVEYATFAILHLIGVPSQIANGIAVVNIDNGYGAGYMATQINRLAERAPKE